MNPVSPETIVLIFEEWRAAGLRPPEALSSPVADAHAAIVWARLLSDLTDDDAWSAARVLARSGRSFFPTAGELLTAARSAEAAVSMSGDEAWSLVAEKVRRHGYYDPPQPPGGELERGRWRLHEDPAVEARLWSALGTCGGWSGRCLLETAQVAAARASFREVFASIEKRDHIRGEIDAVKRIEQRGLLALSMDDEKVVQFPRGRT